MVRLKFKNKHKLLDYSSNKIKIEKVCKLYYIGKSEKKFGHSSASMFKYFEALNEISFEIEPGQCVGLIGLNGSGKSTLANILAGHLVETNGTVELKQTISLLAINSGLKPNLSGVENIRLKMLLMGFSSNEIEKRIQKIIEFTELYDFIDQPMKYYSSGMRAKLGFAIAIQTNPDVLIIDEALSVGDQTFYQKCLNEIDKLKKQNKTIFFVSHAANQIRNMADVVAWIHYGKLKMFGECEEVCLEYSKFVHHFNKLNKKDKQNYQKKMLKTQEKKMLKKIKHRKYKFPYSITFILLFILVISGLKMLGL